MWRLWVSPDFPDGDNTATDESHKKWDSLEPVDVEETWEPVNQDFEYTSRKFDDESGLMEYRARIYNPLIGRFLQKDYFSYKNKYYYCSNKPLWLIDPLGLIDIPNSLFGKPVTVVTKDGEIHRGVLQGIYGENIALQVKRTKHNPRYLDSIWICYIENISLDPITELPSVEEEAEWHKKKATEIEKKFLESVQRFNYGRHMIEKTYKDWKDELVKAMRWRQDFWKGRSNKITDNEALSRAMIPAKLAKTVVSDVAATDALNLSARASGSEMSTLKNCGLINKGSSSDLYGGTAGYSTLDMGLTYGGILCLADLGERAAYEWADKFADAYVSWITCTYEELDRARQLLKELRRHEKEYTERINK